VLTGGGRLKGIERKYRGSTEKGDGKVRGGGGGDGELMGLDGNF
jgi:hypothetical protein